MCDALFEMTKVMRIYCFTARKPSASHIQSIHELGRLDDSKANYFNLVIGTFRNSGYIFVRMKYKITLAPEAVDDLKRLSTGERSTIRDAIEIHL